MKNHIEHGKVFIKEAFSWSYRVPEYQRPYVWSAEEVNDRLQDVANALNVNRDAEHFLGSIVLQKHAGKAIDEYDLLDGQQRLTTCLMLHAVARDLTWDEKLKRSAGRQSLGKRTNTTTFLND